MNPPSPSRITEDLASPCYENTQATIQKQTLKGHKKVKQQLQPLGNGPGHQIWSITVMWSPMRRCNACSHFYLPQ